MEEIKMENDFKWVIKVLNSSKTETHVKNSVKLFDLFILKWVSTMNDNIYKISYTSKFNKAKREIEKNVSLL